MEIIKLGHSSFKLVGKEATIVCDPFLSSRVGIPLPKVEADIVTISHHHEDHDNVEGVKGSNICFDTPGEYEIKNSEIKGIQSNHDTKNGEERGLNTIFTYEIDSINICHLGDLGTALTSDQLDKIGEVDVLLIPVGGTYTIGPKEAIKVISDINPKIVIPMHYKVSGMPELLPVEDFIKEIGKDPKSVDKLKIQKKDLPDELEVYILG